MNGPFAQTSSFNTSISFDSGKLTSTNDIFLDRTTYLNCLRLFYAYFNEVPNCKTIFRVDVKKATAWFKHAFGDQIEQVHSRESYFPSKRKMEYIDVMFILKNGLLLDMEKEAVYIVYSAGKETEAQALLQQFTQFLKRKKKTREISLVVHGVGGLTTHALKLKKPRLDIHRQYNDDFAPVHDKIVRSLRRPGRSGLMLLHGAPGTGKSTYIRYLIHQQSRPVIFLSPGLAMQMDSPGFMDFLTDHKGSIFVIEDAEELLVARGGERHSSISMLLNMTDGLLGECLGIQVIATFNTALSKLDTALLRKGRLVALYEFTPLVPSKVATLMQVLGIRMNITTAMTLADIYNAETEVFQYKGKAKPIGFQFQVA